MLANIDPNLLKPRQCVSEPDWRIWEKKNLNIHRGVIEWSVADTFDTVSDIASRVRNGVKTEFRPGWFRGFGFGTVLHLNELSNDFAQICNHIDRRNKRHGVWQWAILQFDNDKVAIGVHTWLHGYLRPAYESIITHLDANGYECTSVDAEIDELFAAVAKIQRACLPLRLLAGIAT